VRATATEGALARSTTLLTLVPDSAATFLRRSRRTIIQRTVVRMMQYQYTIASLHQGWDAKVAV